MDVVRIFINIISNTVIKPIFISTTFNVTWAGGGARGPAASNILMWFFIDLSNWPKISWLFLKFTWENFVNFFLVISVNYCWRYHFSTKVILVKKKILYILMQWSKLIIYNIFLYCKIIISFLELFSATCFRVFCRSS